MSRRNSKTQEEAIEGTHILPLAVRFVESDYFKLKIESFLLKHVQQLANEAGSVSGGEFFDDVSHEYMDVFQEYQELIDDLLGEFAMNNQLQTREVYSACRDAVDGKFAALFEENEHKWFVDMLMSWMNFEDFFKKIHETHGKSKRRYSNPNNFK